MHKRVDMPRRDPEPAAEPPATERRVLRSNPPAVPPDWSALVERIQRDFPITLARLAE